MDYFAVVGYDFDSEGMVTKVLKTTCTNQLLILISATVIRSSDCFAEHSILFLDLFLTVN